MIYPGTLLEDWSGMDVWNTVFYLYQHAALQYHFVDVSVPRCLHMIYRSTTDVTLVDLEVIGT